MRRYACALALGLCLPTTGFAETAPVIVVFDLEDSRPKRKRLPAPELRALTQFLRTQLAAQGRFQVIPTSELRAALRQEKRASYRACIDESCQIEIGRELAAEKSVSAKLAKVGSKCLLTVSIYDLARSATETAATNKGACDADALVVGLERVARKLRGDKGKSAGFARAVVDIGELDAVDIEDVGGASFGDLDVDYLQLVQAAKRLEKNRGPVDVTAREKAWARIAAYKGDNPLAETAERRAAYWRKVGKLKTRFDADRAKLDKLLALDADVLPQARKEAAQQEFSEAYAPYRGALAAIGVELPWVQLKDGRFCPLGAKLRRGGTKMEQCMRGNRRHGPYWLRRRNETLQGNFNEGVKSGLWIRTRGKRRSECRYADGKMEGPCREWKMKGGKKAELESDCTYRRDKKHGKCTTYQSDGARREATYDNGRLDGLAVTFNAAGQRFLEEPYAKGRLHGKVRRFHESGAVSTETVYVAGKREGPHQTFDLEGKPRLRGAYLDGQRHGDFVWTSPKGEEWARRTFDRGTGEWLRVSSSGTITAQSRFEAGRRRESTRLRRDGSRVAKQYWGPKGAKIGQWVAWDEDGRLCCEADFTKAAQTCTKIKYLSASGDPVPRLDKARNQACFICGSYELDLTQACMHLKSR